MLECLHSNITRPHPLSLDHTIIKLSYDLDALESTTTRAPLGGGRYMKDMKYFWMTWSQRRRARRRGGGQGGGQGGQGDP